MRTILAGIAMAVLAAGAAPGYAVVTKAVLSADPGTYRGDCPGVIKFKGTISVSAPATVHYIFTRSDGATDTITKTLTFKKAGAQSVETTWTLGGAGLPFYQGWEAIKVLGHGPLTSNEAKFVLKCDPPLNSARAAHGNTDWHLQTANEFLFGTDMNGKVMAANHAPDSWSKTHVHVGLTNTSKYYFDHAVLPAGADTDAGNGIDMPMLFFYAGHGNPVIWNTLGDNGTQKDVKLANIAQGGTLRYYWQCSCQVFAHGPLCPSTDGEPSDYVCPQSWAGGADSGSMRNVFERWGPALSPDLRMACGISSLAYCHEDNVNHIWDDYNNKGMSVAESFIDGLGDYGVVPLCITLGGADITKTPLYDAAFTNRPNTSGSSYYHILYAAGNGSAPTPSQSIPPFLPKLAMAPAAAAALPGVDLHSARPIAPLSTFAGGRALVRLEPVSGALHLVAEKQRAATEKPLEEKEYRARALAAVRNLGWDGAEVGEPKITRILSASMPVGGKTGDVKQAQQSVHVIFRRQIALDGNKVEVLGEGGVMHLTLSNGGQVNRASRVWRQVRAASTPVRVKTFEEARAAAEKQLEKPDVYRLSQWRWGYKELAGNVKQDELAIVFQFAFVPRNSKDLTDYPPRLVEIAGQD